MLPYVIIFAVFAVAAAIAGLNPAVRSQRGLVAAAILLVLAIGLRREVGADWFNYLIVLDQIKLGSFERAMTRIEPGYGLLNWLAGQLNVGIWLPNLVCAAIFVWGLMVFSRQQPTPALALLVALPYLIIGVGMGYTRQSAALGFVLLALTRYHRGWTLRMGLYLVLAASFHNSALVVVPLLAVAAAQRRVVTVAMVALLAAVLLYQFSGHILNRMTAYTQGTFIAGGAVPRLAMNVIPALIFLAMRRRFSDSAEELRLWTIFAVAALFSIALLFVVPSTTVVDRIGIYLIPLQIYVLSRLPILFGSRFRQNMLVVTGLIAYSGAVQFTWLNYGTWGHAWVPYKNYLWDDGRDELVRRPRRI